MNSGLSITQALVQFAGKTCLSLETYRRDGRRIRTTVWFVLDQDVLCIRTLQDSGKVKRIRGNANVRAVPSSFGGEPMGSWIEATAELIGGKESVRINDLFKGKYGIQKTLTDLGMSLRGKRYVMYRLKMVDRLPGDQKHHENW